MFYALLGSAERLRWHPSLVTLKATPSDRINHLFIAKQQIDKVCYNTNMINALLGSAERHDMASQSYSAEGNPIG